jgi:uncharacterized protein with von Willebrand factor type A (vWA) domain
MGAQQDMIRRLFGGGGHSAPPPLPRNAVEHDSIDKMEFRMRTDDSPRFRRLAVDEAPVVVPKVELPPAPDFTDSSPEGRQAVADWQEQARKAKELEANAPPYDAWSDLTSDVFYSYHHAEEPEVKAPGDVDPAIAHHAKIAAKMVAEDAHAESRNITRNRPDRAALATMAALRSLKDGLEEELAQQAQQSEQFEQERATANSATQRLESLRDEARELHENGQPIPADLKDAITKAVMDKRQAQAQAAQTAMASPIPMDAAGAEVIKRAVDAGKEAAKSAALIPSFDQGFGKGEPRYESPEQALSIADQWINNPILKNVAELYGRLDQDMRFQRARRVVGGADEIVDLKFGDDIRRVLPVELGALADEDYEDDFYMRWLGSEIRVYDTVGDEQAGRGPIILVGDESGSMNGERNVWLKALALCLLNIARREDRDFAYVGFGSAGEVEVFLFKAKEDMPAQRVVDMAGHFFGGGTVPIGGVMEATKIMEEREFKKADIVLVGDGQAGFGNEDAMLRDKLLGRGVRLWGIGIGAQMRSRTYLHDYCGDEVLSIHDFDLQSPGEATAHLATHIT